MKDERGFTLAEVTTALLVFGILLSAVFPVYVELKRLQQEQDRRFTASLLLQSRMERLQKPGVPASLHGGETRRAGPVSYRISWKKWKVQPRLTGAEVVVRWKDPEGKDHRLALRSYQYAP